MRLDPHPGAPRPGLWQGATPWETALFAALGVAMTMAIGIWLCGQLAGLLFGDGWPAVCLAEAGALLVRLPGNLSDPARAWPTDVRSGLPGAAGFYATIAFLAAALAAAAFGIRRVVAGTRRRGPRGAGRDHGRSSAWATRRELAMLATPKAAAGRLVLGRVGGRLIAAEPRQSVVLIAPTQSLKTTGLAIPALLEWEGPAVAASVKSDLLRDTLARRRQLGQALVYDPTGATGISDERFADLVLLLGVDPTHHVGHRPLRDGASEQQRREQLGRCGVPEVRKRCAGDSATSDPWILRRWHHGMTAGRRFCWADVPGACVTWTGTGGSFGSSQSTSLAGPAGRAPELHSRSRCATRCAPRSAGRRRSTRT